MEITQCIILQAMDFAFKVQNNNLASILSGQKLIISQFPNILLQKTIFCFFSKINLKQLKKTQDIIPGQMTLFQLKSQFHSGPSIFPHF